MDATGIKAGSATGGRGARNLTMAERIEATPVAYPFRFVVAGDSGAWPDPTADAIFAELVAQVAALDPPAVFFTNLGDFAGPGTMKRHEHYLTLVEPLPIPDVCVVGNHDLDDVGGPDAFARVHGPTNFCFAYGHTRFVAIDGAPGVPGVAELAGAESPEDFEDHAVELTFSENGALSGRVIQAFDRLGTASRHFGVRAGHT